MKRKSPDLRLVERSVDPLPDDGPLPGDASAPVGFPSLRNREAAPVGGWSERVRTAQQGDVVAFESLVREHQGAVYAFAVAQLGDLHEARDAAQETLVKAFRRLDTYRFAAPFRTWLLQITRNGCRDRQRRQRTRRLGLQRLRAQGAPADPPVNPERELQAREATARVHEALAHIDPLYREVIVLFDLQGRSYPEIAEICGIPLGTVKSRLSRGREALRRVLLGSNEEATRPNAEHSIETPPPTSPGRSRNEHRSTTAPRRLEDGKEKNR